VNVQVDQLAGHGYGCHIVIPGESAVVHGLAMATKKKTPGKKAAVKKAKKAAPRKATAKKVKKVTPKKRAATSRQPPMHAKVSHLELSDSQTEHGETFEIFKSFDRDGSGSIDRMELARLLEALGQELPEVELEVALEVIDSNHSGRISWEEFKAWWSAR
jgi:Ca2+-binding EF-hand superfamily protein